MTTGLSFTSVQGRGAPVGPLSLEYRPAPPEVAGLVSSVYVFEARLPRVMDVLRAELPQIRLMVTGRGTYAYGGGVPLDVPRAALAGPSLSAARFEAQGPLLIVGCGLMPAGWAALVGERADAVADTLVPLEELLPGAGADRLVQRMADVAAVASGLLRDRTLGLLFERWLVTLAARARPVPWWLTRQLDGWLVGSADPSVDQLVRMLGLSARQAERWTARIYGAPPKLLARKYRALQAAVRLGLHPQQGWQGAALDAFYDQSHFIREFRTFVGVTPSAFLAAGSPWLTRLTISKRQQAPLMPRLNLVS